MSCLLRISQFTRISMKNKNKKGLSKYYQDFQEMFVVISFDVYASCLDPSQITKANIERVVFFNFFLSIEFWFSIFSLIKIHLCFIVLLKHQAADKCPNVIRHSSIERSIKKMMEIFLLQAKNQDPKCDNNKKDLFLRLLLRNQKPIFL